MTSNFTHVFDGDEITAANFNAWLNAATDSAISSVITGASSTTASYATWAGSASTATYALDATNASSATTAAFATDAASASTSTYAIRSWSSNVGRVGDTAATADVVLALNDSLSSWTAKGLYAIGSPYVANTSIVRVSGKTTVGINLNADSDASYPMGIAYCDLASDYARGSYTHLAPWLYYRIDGANGTEYDVPLFFDYVISDQTGLRGDNAVRVPYPFASESSWIQPHIDITSLNTIRSFGIDGRNWNDSNAGATDQRVVFRFEDVSLLTIDQEQATLQAFQAGVIPSEFSSVAKLGFLPTLVENKPLLDLGAGARNVISLEQAGIDTTGVTDASAALETLVRDSEPYTKIICERGAAGKILLDSRVQLTGRNIHLDFGGAAILQGGTVNGNNAVFRLYYLRDSVIENFRIYGNRVRNELGSDLTDVSGSVVNGTTRELDALNDECAQRASAANDNDNLFGRDEEGYVRVDFNLSDSAQVADDCMIFAYDVHNDVELARDIVTLTGTETTYPLKFYLQDLRARIKWGIRKMTSTTNTITVHSLDLYKEAVYAAPQEGASGFVIGSGTQHVEIRNGVVEGVGGDAVNFGTGTHGIRDVTIRNFMSRCVARQGISINGGIRCSILDTLIIGAARHSVDIEPTGDTLVRDLVMQNIYMYDGQIGNLVANNWSDVLRPRFNNIFVQTTKVGNTYKHVDIGGREAFITNVHILATEEPYEESGSQGALSADFSVQGRDVFIDNCTADVGFQFETGTGSYLGTTYTCGNYHKGRLFVRRAAQKHSIVDHTHKGVTQHIISTAPDDVPALGRNAKGVRAHGAFRHRNSGDFGGMHFALQQHHYPETYRGPAYSSLWMPGGFNLRSQNVLGVTGISGEGARYELLASTSTNTLMQGSAVEVGAFRHLQVTANISDLSDTVDLGVQVSHDGSTNWRSLDSFWQFTEDGARGTLKLRTAAEPWVRINLEPSAGTATVDVQALAWTPSHNFTGTEGVTSTATQKFVSFSTREYPNIKSFSLSAGTYSGSLTSGTSYFYRVAARPLLGGPVVAASEQSIVATETGSIDVDVTYDRTGLVEQGPITIYRGTTSGSYNARFDVMPNELGFASLTTDQQWVDSGNTVFWRELITSDPIAWGFSTDASTVTTAGTTPADETGYEVDANYKVMITPNWDTTAFVAQRDVSGFTVEFGTAAGSGATFDWFLLR